MNVAEGGRRIQSIGTGMLKWGTLLLLVIAICSRFGAPVLMGVLNFLPALWMFGGAIWALGWVINGFAER